MTRTPAEHRSSMIEEVRALARPLETRHDLEPLVTRARAASVTCIGEASHGTADYYRWRAELTRSLVEDAGYTWIGVEGDWPDCWRINLWVRGIAEPALDARALLGGFRRWPRWMWANTDVADFLDWLREWNRSRPEAARVGFYGLDVYSLWESLQVIMDWLAEHSPASLPSALRAWQCFEPYAPDPHRYARATRLVPKSCESEVVALLAEVVRRGHLEGPGSTAPFNVVQNAITAVRAEAYYRVMVWGNRESWNLRDEHMVDTVGRLAEHLGPGSKGVLWEHNTHIGDARATDLGSAGMVTVGQLLRQRLGPGNVLLVGMAGHRGSVVAAADWGGPHQVMDVPTARAGSHEDLLHHALGKPALLDFADDNARTWLSTTAPQRAIGVVYDPGREQRNYVPTTMGGRYDALLWLESTDPLTPLRAEEIAEHAELETEPSGF